MKLLQPEVARTWKKAVAVNVSAIGLDCDSSYIQLAAASEFCHFCYCCWTGRQGAKRVLQLKNKFGNIWEAPLPKLEIVVEHSFHFRTHE